MSGLMDYYFSSFVPVYFVILPKLCISVLVDLYLLINIQKNIIIEHEWFDFEKCPSFWHGRSGHPD